VISLCMIVKNEEDTLARCLASAKDIADEIIIVDTGSTDRTKEVARAFTDHIFDFVWIDDFSAARNYSFSLATQEYILWLDADDVIEEKDRKLFLELKQTLDPSVNSVRMNYNLVVDDHGNVVWSLARDRLVRRACHFQWIGAVHEYLAVSGNVKVSEIAITHKRSKPHTDRNLQIYRRRHEAGEPFTPRDLYYFANELRDHAFYQEAVDFYEQFLRTKLGWVEDNIAACIKIADCFAHLGNRDKQYQALLQTLVYDKPRAEFCCQLGELFMEEQQWEKAIFWYALAASLGAPPDSGMLVNHAAWTWLPHLQLCVCYDRLGDYDKARYHNDLALSHNPTHPSMLYNKEYFDKKFSDTSGDGRVP